MDQVRAVGVGLGGQGLGSRSSPIRLIFGSAGCRVLRRVAGIAGNSRSSAEESPAGILEHGCLSKIPAGREIGRGLVPGSSTRGYSWVTPPGSAGCTWTAVLMRMSL